MTDQSPGARLARMGAALTVACVGTWLLLRTAETYAPFLADDALISLRYSQRLLAGHGLTWTDGPRVEGYSNLLWVLLVAAIGVLRVELIPAAIGLGKACTVLLLLAIAVSQLRRGVAATLATLPAIIAIALTGTIAIWSIGGLEQPLFGALVAWGMVAAYALVDEEAPARRRVILAGLLFGLAALTRPDGMLFPVVVSAAVVLVRRDREGMKQAALLVGVAAVFYVGQLGFRLLYYDDWVPNTAYAKVAMTRHRVEDGWHYVMAGARSLGGFLWLSVIATVLTLVRPETRRRLPLLLLPLVAWLTYVCIVGGDIFPGFRHFHVPIALLALLCAEGASVLVKQRWYWRAAGVGVAIWLVQDVPRARDAMAENNAAHQERWEWQGEVIGRVLKQAFSGQQPLLAVDSAGCLPWFSELPSVDMLGLNDRYLGHHRPATLGTEFLGHELGDGPYVLSRKPDLIAFCGPGGSLKPCFLSGRQMMKDPSFKRDYRPVRFRGTQPFTVDATIYVRTKDGPLATQRSSARVDVPGYVVLPYAGSTALLDGSGRLGTTWPDQSQTVTLPLSLEAGTWDVALDASAPALEMDAPMATCTAGRCTLTLTEPADVPLNLRRVQPGPVLLFGLAATRHQD